METILIVDDDPSARMVLSAILAGEGFGTVDAADGTEGRAVLEQDHATINAVLLDWQMPGMNGLQLLQWMKGQPPLENTPVILQTAMNTPEQVKQGVDAGAFYYLTKPIQEKLLLSIVRAALEDARYKASLLDQLKECQNPLILMREGTFQFSTLREAERLSLWIANAAPSPSRAMGINELFINAIEHGNLGITYEEKTTHVEEGTWLKEIDRRLALPEHAGKCVEVKITRYEDRMEVLVQDQGPGFDFEKYLHLDESRLFDNHGRGIAVAGASLELKYRGSGSTVLVTIPYEVADDDSVLLKRS